MIYTIPKEFDLLCWHFKVVRKELLDKEGYADFDEGIIYLDKELEGDYLLQTFFHEVRHIMKYAMGEEDHIDKEVDMWGAMMAQIMKTSKGML